MLLETIRHDTAYALRTMRKNPGFAATAVLVLTLGIGGNAAMFTVIRTVLLKPLDYRDPDRLVEVSGGATPVRFEEMRASAQSFTGLGAFGGQESLTLTGAAEPEVLRGARVSADFLGILGVDAIFGRSFLPEEDSPGAAPVAMISAELWQRRFAGDAQIAGKTVTLAYTPYTIVGVLPPRFQFPSPENRRVGHAAIGVVVNAAQVAPPEPVPEHLRPLEAGGDPQTSECGDGGVASPFVFGSATVARDGHPGGRWAHSSRTSSAWSWAKASD
jgi:hypothetical protein